MLPKADDVHEVDEDNLKKMDHAALHMLAQELGLVINDEPSEKTLRQRVLSCVL